MTIRASVYPYPPIQFQICTELIHKTKQKRQLHQHWRLKREVAFNTLSKISICKTEQKEERADQLSIYCKWKKNPPGEQVATKKQNPLTQGWLRTAEGGVEVDVGRPQLSSALGQYTGAWVSSEQEPMEEAFLLSLYSEPSAAGKAERWFLSVSGRRSSTEDDCR